MSARDAEVTITEDNTLRVRAGDRYDEAFNLPADVHPDDAKASCIDGVLRVVFPRKRLPGPLEMTVEKSLPEKLHDTLYVPGLAPEEIGAKLQYTPEGPELRFTGESKKGFGSLDYSWPIPRRLNASAVRVGVENGILGIGAAEALEAEGGHGSQVEVKPRKGSPEGSRKEILREAVPGIQPDQVQAQVGDGRVLVSVRMEGEERGMSYSEELERVAELPHGVSSSQVEIHVADGIISASVPESAIREPSKKRIEISGSKPAMLTSSDPNRLHGRSEYPPSAAEL